MSYPPGTPPPYSHQPHPPPGRDPRQAARRAGILLFVLGAGIALLGIVNITQTLSLSPERFREQFEEQQRMMPQGSMPAPPVPLETLRVMSIVIAGIMTAVGLFMMVLGGPVRRSARWAMIASIVVAGVVGVTALFAAGVFGVMGLAAPPLLGLACCSAVPLALCVLLVVWAIQGLRTGAVTQPGAYPWPPGAWPPPYGQPTAQQPSVPPPPAYSPQYLPPAPPQVPQPPPGQPPVQFGYATRPQPAQPPPGEAPVPGQQQQPPAPRPADDATRQSNDTP